MRTTMNLDDALMARAQELAGPMDRTALVHTALKALIEREAARRLAALIGTEPQLLDVPRRRPEPNTE